VEHPTAIRRAICCSGRIAGYCGLPVYDVRGSAGYPGDR
jgi:hypothetical protein